MPLRVVTDTVVDEVFTTHADTDITVDAKEEVTSLDDDVSIHVGLINCPSSFSATVPDTLLKVEDSSFPVEVVTEVVGNGVVPAVATAVTWLLLLVGVFVMAVLAGVVTVGVTVSVVELPPRSFCAARFKNITIRKQSM